MNRLQKIFAQVFSRENQLAIVLCFILVLLVIFTARYEGAWFMYGDF